MIGRSRMDGDTCRDRGCGIADTFLQLCLVVWTSKPLADGLPGLGLKTYDGVRGGIWHYRGVCVESKLSREGLVAVGFSNFYLDHFAPELSDSTKISKDKFQIG